MKKLKGNTPAIRSITINIFLLFAILTFALIKGSPINQNQDSSSVIASETILTEDVVLEHSTINDCWIIVESNVYAVTNYINLHPGGQKSIVDVCGIDATDVFNTKGNIGTTHSENANSLLKSYLIGSLNTTLSESTISEITNLTDLDSDTNNDSVVSEAVIPSISSHNTATDCWMTINGSIYNVTNYIQLHPGGQLAITKYCGKDGTNGFNTKDTGNSHSTSATELLAKYKITPTTSNPDQDTPVAVTPTPPEPVTSTVTLNMTEVSKHNTKGNCWFVISNKVYNVTSYIPFHPGGQTTIINRCGVDATSAYTNQGHSLFAASQLAKYFIGDLNTTINDTTSDSGGSNNTGDGASTINSPEAAIIAEYPSASILEVETEDDGISKVKFRNNGKKYEATLDSNYNITSVKED